MRVDFSYRRHSVVGSWKCPFLNPRDLFVSDGSKDGKVDLFCTTHDGSEVNHHVVNSKFTKEYNKLAPVSFYHEITYLWQAFDNVKSRQSYLDRAVKPELRQRFKTLFEHYDSGTTDLMFITKQSSKRSPLPHGEEVTDSFVPS